jgi:hypothetical protein
VEELSARLKDSRHPLAAPAREATRAYLFMRYGGRPLSPAERSRLLSGLRGAVKLA